MKTEQNPTEDLINRNLPFAPGRFRLLARRSWARVIRGRLPVIGLPNADILHHGPPPAYAHGREAVGGAEARPQVHPGVVCGARAAAGL